jgi:hypothetical protein
MDDIRENTVEQERAARDGRGRFRAGNPGGPGNPFARQTAALRKALVNAVTEEDMQQIAQALLEKARQGDTGACRLLLSYTVGKPAAAVEPDRLDQDELALTASNHVALKELERVADLIPVDVVLRLVRVVLPYLSEVKASRLASFFEEGKVPMKRAEEDDAEVLSEAEKSEPGTSDRGKTLAEAVREWERDAEECKAQLWPMTGREGVGGGAEDGEKGHDAASPPEPAGAKAGAGPAIVADEVSAVSPSTNGLAAVAGAGSVNKRHPGGDRLTVNKRRFSKRVLEQPSGTNGG